MELFRELGRESLADSQTKGFNTELEPNIAEKLMLIVSEIGEACEADRKSKRAFQKIPTLGELDKVRELLTSSFNLSPTDGGKLYKEIFEEHIKDTFEDELADAAIRIMGLAFLTNVDLGYHIRAKMDYNKLRDHKHGGKSY